MIAVQSKLAARYRNNIVPSVPQVIPVPPVQICILINVSCLIHPKHKANVFEYIALLLITVNRK